MDNAGDKKSAGIAGMLPNAGSRRSPRRDDVEFNELNISLKISYKTLLLVFVLFDVLHRTVNVLFDLDLP